MSLRLSDLQSARCSVDSLNRLFRPESVKASIAAAEASEPVIELSTLQTIALLRMNRSTLCRGYCEYSIADNFRCCVHCKRESGF